MKIFSYIAGKTVRFGKKLFGKTATKIESSLFGGSSLRGVKRAANPVLGTGTDYSSIIIAESAENISRAKALATLRDDIVFDELVPLPAKIAKALKIKRSIGL